MKRSHQRRIDPDAPHQHASHVIVRSQDKEFSVLRLAPQYPAGPEHVVCAGNNAVAHFFQEADAQAYSAWRNQHATGRGGS